MLQLVTHDRDLLRKQVDKLSTERANVVVPLHHRQLSQPQLSKVGTDRGTGKLDDERTINIPVLIFFFFSFFSINRLLSLSFLARHVVRFAGCGGSGEKPGKGYLSLTPPPYPPPPPDDDSASTNQSGGGWPADTNTRRTDKNLKVDQTSLAKGDDDCREE